MITTEKTTEDATIQAGDYVTLPGNAQGTTWESGIVESIDPHGHLCIGFGSRHTAPHMRCHSYSTHPDEVGELWRQRRISKQYSFVFEGRTIEGFSSEYEWYRVW